ncbi:secretion protein EspK [Mycobacterium pseudokansasii]|uniref:ESX-1 secretion-associated protein EspK n=1 Tax=Mycobacterium pseudokansasii TaxID=2341080 RepID=A0A498QTW3_9MYCO|nr:secretion protein EspK [Mycobacterium pseudokansasii]VBA30524.1 ESX-1 secretion-associated protein EspK [Mycobacterium pseudokansasii]VBA32336.1 ESX-1 secretion-associated protein EspK [Mycobacterium pseudokansasii]VBA54451.1 ESX-1 secretion-associated protein EspK [Mycobacterium pseudokansasii]
MSVPRPTGEYAEQMLESGGWPGLDEDAFHDRAQKLTQVLRQVSDVLQICQQQRSEIFDAGIWSGGAADAANGEVDGHIEQLRTLQDNVTAAIAWHAQVAGLSAQAKSNISDNVEGALREINILEHDPKLDIEERRTAINALVSEARGVNLSVVADTAEQILASKAWKAAPSALQYLLDRKTPPPATNPEVSARISAAPTVPTEERADLLAVVPAEFGVRQPVSETFGSAHWGSLSAAESPGRVRQSAVHGPGAESGTPVTPTAVGEQPPRAGGPEKRLDAAAPQPLSPRLAGNAPRVLPAGVGGRSPLPAAPTGDMVRLGNASPGGADDGGPISSGWPAGSSAGAGWGLGPAAGPAPSGPPPVARTVPPDGGAGRARSVVRTELGNGTPPEIAAAAMVPVSAARAARDTIAAACTAEALRRKRGGADPLRLARRIAAALNAPDGGGADDLDFFWITAVTIDGAIVVANSYGLAYIPDEVRLPDQIQLASADDSIPVAERVRCATYPMLAVQAWAVHHNRRLRAVIGTEEQLSNCDSGAAKVVLEPDDIPDSGRMRGRSRLEVIDSVGAARLADTSDLRLVDLLPPAPVAANRPSDERVKLWFRVIEPMASEASGRTEAHLRAFHIYAAHSRELALHQAHSAAAPAAQRAAVADWLYWQHLNGLLDRALSHAR